jgi:GNAT superfamily N-acetyltransferase
VNPPPAAHLPLVSSLDRIRRTVAAELAYTVARLKVVERQPGNPFGVALRRVGENAMALMARRVPVPSFNSVVGLRAGDADAVAPLAEWYAENGVAGRFEFVPGLADESLARAAHAAGYFHSASHASLIVAPPPEPPPLPAEISIEVMRAPAQMDEYFDAYLAGWDFRHGDRERFKANVCGWLGLPGWTLYLARLGGRPAAIATLFMHEGVGYCADAATNPAFRGRGLHRALLHRRFADAAAAGAEFICSGAEFLSPSHRNMERAGMRLQFVRAIWTRPQ